MWACGRARGELGWSAQTNLHNASRQGNPLALGAFDFLGFRFEYILVPSYVGKGTCRFQSSHCPYLCQGQRAKMIPNALMSTGRLCCLPALPCKCKFDWLLRGEFARRCRPLPRRLLRPPPVPFEGHRQAEQQSRLASPPCSPSPVPSASDLGKARALPLSLHGRCCRAAQESKAARETVMRR